MGGHDQFASAAEALEEQHPELTVTFKSLTNQPERACDEADIVFSFDSPPDSLPCELESEEAGYATAYYIEETPAIRAYIDALIAETG